LFSPLLELKTAPPLDTDTVLKLLVLYSESDKENACKIGKRLMSPPLKEQGVIGSEPEIRPELVLRFSLEFLYHLKLINAEGNPTGFVGLVTHISEIYPANYVLCYLMINGGFDELLKPYFTTTPPPQDITGAIAKRRACRESLMHILACLIFPTKSGKLTSNSLDTLPLPKNILGQLQGYMNLTQSLISNAAAIFKEHSLGDLYLPKSPQLELPDLKNLDSYAYDFYKHGQIANLVTSKQGDYSVYAQLIRWDQVLHKIATAVSQLADQTESNPFALALIDLAVDFRTAFNKIQY